LQLQADSLLKAPVIILIAAFKKHAH
jgi:hypothetical protein